MRHILRDLPTSLVPVWFPVAATPNQPAHLSSATRLKGLISAYRGLSLLHSWPEGPRSLSRSTLQPSCLPAILLQPISGHIKPHRSLGLGGEGGGMCAANYWALGIAKLKSGVLSMCSVLRAAQPGDLLELHTLRPTKLARVRNPGHRFQQAEYLKPTRRL